ncbi:TonB-dependent receptor [Methylomonas sp. MK1]|uniref:TonB-dependent receptor n=1 Tax=Methylomonas sp. MK1 TaxID=1131552 RepID=UPI00037BE2A5|nr:TonB-dependent receptor [Methylomonas sp. MK1]
MKHAKIKLSAKPCLLGAMLLTVLPGASATEDGKPDNKTGSNQTAVLPEMTVTAEGGKAATQTTTEKYKLPAVTESVTREKMEDTINVMNTEDAIKYLPNILVRKRYIGDKEMPVSMRTSGTGSSARSLIYADGILLSSLLGNNNGMTGSPRWNMVSPSEIERVDVMYGPFSAAYGGNSIGGVIDITTRMPEKFEAGGGVQSAWQEYDVYGHTDVYDSQQYTANLGSRHGDFSWRFDVSHLDAHSQPVTYSYLVPTGTYNSTRSPTAPLSNAQIAALPVGTAITPVMGAVGDLDRTNVPYSAIGEGNIRHTVQDNFKWKLAYDITPTLKATYTLGLWQNDESGGFKSYLNNAVTGLPVNSGYASFGGKTYNLDSPSFAQNDYQQMHWSHGMALKSNTGGIFDWELTGSVINYGQDEQRAPTVAPNRADAGGAGRITSLNDTGWHTVDAKGIWRPESAWGPHHVSFGYHHDFYELNNQQYNTSNWLYGGKDSLFTNSQGKTETNAIWIQDAWTFDPDWTLTLGGRLENWNAFDGTNTGSNGRTINQSNRSDLRFSPKASLAWKPTDSWKITSSIAQAYRFPTVTELFQGTNVGSGGTANIVNPNPTLKPEEALSSELSAQYFLSEGSLRLSLFHEKVYDAIYSQTTFSPSTNSSLSYAQNIDQISTYGWEFSGEHSNVVIDGLDLAGNVTWANSRIDKNAALPASVGKYQPRVPEWRASATATYHVTKDFTSSISGRYSSQQYGQIDNSDVNPDTYTGTGSAFFVVDTRAKYQLTKQLTLSAGIDNITNEKYWLFHVFPQRTYIAELKFNY